MGVVPFARARRTAVGYDPGMAPDDMRTPEMRALAAAVPTSRHASMLVDAVVDLLGARAFVDTANDGNRRRVYERDADNSDWVIPWPAVEVFLGGRLWHATDPIQLRDTPPPPPRERRVPRLRNLGFGDLRVGEAESAIELRYAETGVLQENCGNASPAAPPALASIAPARPGSPLEQVAERIAALDRAQRGPGRVRLPVPTPDGVPGAWAIGLISTRDALFDGRVPPGARWVAADGWAGTAFGHGATRDEALERWLAEVRRVRPGPAVPDPDEPPTETSLEVVEERPDRVRFAGALAGTPDGVPRPELVPENTPAVLIALAPPPDWPPPFGAWMRLLDEYGRTEWVALRHDPDGFTLVGGELLGRSDLARLDQQLDAADRAAAHKLEVPEGEWPAHLPRRDSRVVTYRAVDERGRSIAPSVDGVEVNPGFRGRILQATKVRNRVVRQRWIA